MIQNADGTNQIIQMAQIPTMPQGGQVVMVRNFVRLGLYGSEIPDGKNVTKYFQMIPNPVSPSQNIAKIQQPAEVAEEEPLYVNAKQVYTPQL